MEWSAPRLLHAARRPSDTRDAGRCAEQASAHRTLRDLRHHEPVFRLYLLRRRDGFEQLPRVRVHAKHCRPLWWRNKRCDRPDVWSRAADAAGISTRKADLSARVRDGHVFHPSVLLVENVRGDGPHVFAVVRHLGSGIQDHGTAGRHCLSHSGGVWSVARGQLAGIDARVRYLVCQGGARTVAVDFCATDSLFWHIHQDRVHPSLLAMGAVFVLAQMGAKHHHGH
mmetsp:Transcript_26325/g.69170  ORF Transcript_26325/g.69170 Transcript_26325/m.69170 type:complete len:226 (+) Transcript_26325:1085-1762(+)